ncbi:MAG: hypothetical protein IIV59_07400 [Selenomonadaceae bacterium]|nr:hypothetical protein [Selenomonadaceae bacterium]
MSAWTDFRDDIIDSFKFDDVTEELKVQFSNWLVETVLPLAHTAADSFITQTKAQAADEKGWCKARDLIVLPAVINLGLWFTEKALVKTNVPAN